MTQQAPPPENIGPAERGYPVPHQPAPGPVKTNTMAVLALVFAFVIAPLGIVFGVIGRRQISRTGEKGRGLATAGLVLGIIFTVLAIAAIALGGSFSFNVSAGGTSVPSSGVAQQITEQSQGQATDVSCPNDLAGQVGATETCTATVNGQPAQIKVTVTSVQGNTVNFQIQQQ